MFKSSAEQGVVEAKIEVGNCYYYGIGVKKNIKYAREVFNKLVENGNQEIISLFINW